MHALFQEVEIQMVNRRGDIVVPEYATSGASGMDVQADITAPVILHTGERHLFPCGFKLAVPVGFEIQVRPRSGLALKQGLTVLNTPGTVDSDYRGEVGVILMNTAPEPVTISPGSRIAQIVLCPVTRAVFTETNELSATTRGEGGYGSTGVNASAPLN